MIPQQEVLGDLLRPIEFLPGAVSRPLRLEEGRRVFSPAASNAKGARGLYPQRENQILGEEICPPSGLKGDFRKRRLPGNSGGSLKLRGEISVRRRPSTGVNHQDGTIGLLLRKFGVAWALSETGVHPGIWSVERTLSEAKVRAETFGPGAAMLDGATLQEKALGVRKPSETMVYQERLLAGRALSEAKALAKTFGPGAAMQSGVALQEKSVAAVEGVRLTAGPQQREEGAVWVAADTKRVKRNKVVSGPMGTR